MRKHCGLTRHRSNGHCKVRSLIHFKSQESDYHIWWKCVTTLTVPNFIPQNAIPLKIPRYLNCPNFSPNVAEIPNLETNSPKVGSLLKYQSNFSCCENFRKYNGSLFVHNTCTRWLQALRNFPMVLLFRLWRPTHAPRFLSVRLWNRTC